MKTTVQVPNHTAEKFETLAFEFFLDLQPTRVETRNQNFHTTFEFNVMNEDEEATIDQFHTDFLLEN